MSQASAESSRSRILAATCEVIGGQGIASFAVKDVARAAGVTTQLLYYHFPNRETLVAAALEYANERAPSVNLLQGEPDGTGYDALRAALLAEFDDAPAVRSLNVLWNEVATSSAQYPELHSTLERVTTGWDQKIAVGVLRGMVDGSLRTDLEPHLVARTLTCAVEGLSQRWLAGILTAEQARAALDLLLSSLGRPGAARD